MLLMKVFPSRPEPPSNKTADKFTAQTWRFLNSEYQRFSLQNIRLQNMTKTRTLNEDLADEYLTPHSYPGPPKQLTTIYTPPSTCFEGFPTTRYTDQVEPFVPTYVFHFGTTGCYSCGFPKTAAYASCYPPHFDIMDRSADFYSPGICPKSYTIDTTTVVTVDGKRSYFGACCIS